MPEPSSDSRSPSADAGVISLPVVEGHGHRPTTIRPSRSGRRRAVVLAIVQMAMILHIGWWLLSRRYGWFGGVTTTPIEPSESMEFAKNGVVNAGLVFFVIALVSTMILGRWFCGWGCHLVLLQDLCGWFMKKCGVRPRPFRSRLLVYVPLVLAVYMFLWPAIYRLGHGIGQRLGWIETSIPPWNLHWELTTTEFWRTFPGVLVAIPFLAICGFATVYFLGAKGFCTYGCPYGGFFAPVDRIAPARIRVTDDCEQCGHCTAVCTSNVRVHEEVASYGMVVDPGCMKCLDCVSVCPNDALYFGFGAPAAGRSPRGPRPVRHYDLTWPQEVVFSGVFAVAFFSVRGVYGLVPMLMAAGVAGCVTFLAWKGWQLVRDRHVSFTRTRLKHDGRLTGRGWTFAATAIIVGVLTLHSGAVNGVKRLARYHDDQVTVSSRAVLSGEPYSPEPETVRHARRALRFYELISGFGEGGMGFSSPWQADIDMRRAWLNAAAGQPIEAERVLRRAIDRDGVSDRFCTNLADVIRATGDDARLREYYDATLLEHPELPRLLDSFVRWSVATGSVDDAAALCEQRLERFPDDEPSLRWLALLRLQAGRFPEGIDLLRRAVDLAPNDAGIRQTLAVALGDAGQFTEALQVVQAAIDLHPDDGRLHLLASRLLMQLGDLDTAERALRQALDLASSDPDVHFEAAGLLNRLGKPDEAAKHLERADELRRAGP